MKKPITDDKLMREFVNSIHYQEKIMDTDDGVTYRTDGCPEELPLTKHGHYSLLVEDRKQCDRCNIGLNKDKEPGLVNPSRFCNGEFDSNQIGPWSRWQGNLEADIVVVGQDWGDDRYFKENKGFDKMKTKSGLLYENPTNKRLIHLLSTIGKIIDPPKDSETVGTLFFTTANLCLKNKGGMQGTVKDSWFQNCGQYFLKPLIEIISPMVVIAIGEKAYRAICMAYNIEPSKKFSDAVDNKEGIKLGDDMLLFPVYHCGNRVTNTVRDLDSQKADWKRIGSALQL